MSAFPCRLVDSQGTLTTIKYYLILFLKLFLGILNIFFLSIWSFFWPTLHHLLTVPQNKIWTETKGCDIFLVCRNRQPVPTSARQRGLNSKTMHLVRTVKKRSFLLQRASRNLRNDGTSPAVLCNWPNITAEEVTSLKTSPTASSGGVFIFISHNRRMSVWITKSQKGRMGHLLCKWRHQSQTLRGTQKPNVKTAERTGTFSR